MKSPWYVSTDFVPFNLPLHYLGCGGGEVKGRVGKGEVSICTKEVEESSIIFLRDGEGLSAEGVNERRESPFFPSASQTLDGL